MADEMVRILDEWIRETDVVIEFGSGRSTTWLAKRSGSLISIELDDEWLEIVRGQLEDNGLSHKVDLRYFAAGGENWKLNIESCDYVRSVDDVPDNSVDLVLVDGWARSYCALVGIKKLKPGGILVFDDIHSHWPLSDKRLRRGKIPPLIRSKAHPSHMEKVMHALQNWRCIWVGNGKQDTALWIKPHE